ncbi:MAG: hypothetical protein ACRBBP_08025 [Bdellovibrionales bacterium]
MSKVFQKSVDRFLGDRKLNEDCVTKNLYPHTPSSSGVFLPKLWQPK